MNNSTGNDTGNGIRRSKVVVAALVMLTLRLCTISTTVQAMELPAAESWQAVELRTTELGQTMKLQSTAGISLQSQGSLVYQEKGKGAQIYASDFLLLRERMGTLPDRVFEPSCYTHTHRWEYLNANERTHTRHCEDCGDQFDLVSAHRVKRRESCTFSYEGTEYSGRRYTCECGYQWEQEEAHTLLFEEVDETGHRNRCRLDGTKFCPGYEPVEEEHYAYNYIPCEDGRHHERICIDCGYRDMEECCFTLFDKGDIGESGSGDGSSSQGNGRRYCWCGNEEKQDAEVGENGSDTENGEETAGAETGEEKPDTENGGETVGTEAEEEQPGAVIEEDAETETGEEQPDVDADTEEEEPDTGIGAVETGQDADAEAENEWNTEN